MSEALTFEGIHYSDEQRESAAVKGSQLIRDARIDEAQRSLARIGLVFQGGLYLLVALSVLALAYGLSQTGLNVPDFLPQQFPHRTIGVSYITVVGIGSILKGILSIKKGLTASNEIIDGEVMKNRQLLIQLLTFVEKRKDAKRA